MENKTKLIIQVIFKNAQILDITGPTEVFAQANEFLLHQDQKPAYTLILIADQKGPVTMSSGLKLVADESFKSFNNPLSSIDTILVAGGNGVYQARYQEELLAFVKNRGGKLPQNSLYLLGHIYSCPGWTA